jgi:hypothetical protein
VFEERRRNVRRLLIALPTIASLALASTALAGGWATVGLDSTPEATAPGERWNVNITVLQHGRTPLDGVTPTLTIRNGDATKTFTAKATGKPGVYRASVTFPTAGKWTYTVNDGFVADQAHSFPPVDIGTAASAPAAAPPKTSAPATTDDGGSLTWLAFPGIALLVAAGGFLLRDRRRRGPGQRPQAA